MNYFVFISLITFYLIQQGLFEGNRMIRVSQEWMMIMPGILERRGMCLIHGFL